MSIKYLTVSNFKSFLDSQIYLNNLNVLIGGNASGKSNFISAFNFLRQISEVGLSNAVSMQGGAEYLLNMNIGMKQPLSMSIGFEQSIGLVLKSNPLKKFFRIQNVTSEYQFAVKFYQKKPGFDIKSESLTLVYKVFEVGEKKSDDDKKQPDVELGEFKINISRSLSKYSIDIIGKPSGLPLSQHSVFPDFLQKHKIDNKELLLEGGSIGIPTFEGVFSGIGIYDIDPRLCKNSSRLTGKAELEDDGKNISTVLNKIISDNKSKNRYFNLVNDILPFVENVDVDKLSDKSYLFKYKEKYSHKFLPATFLSDGTITVTGLLLAIFFEDKNLVIIEEPERNIHPSLLSKIVEMLKSASENKQIVITTHNPEFIKHVDLNDILYMNRNNEGISEIKKLRDNREIQVFLQNNLGVDDLFIQNILG